MNHTRLGKYFLALIILTIVGISALTACESEKPADLPVTNGGTYTSAPPAAGGDPYISIIARGFQNHFWQTVYAGAQAAAEEYGVEIFFAGPENEADVDVQVNMLNTELAKNPDAIVLAALDTDAIPYQLQEAYNRGIPVIGFDSGVPEAPTRQVLANASTDNIAAAALGADGMFKAIEDRIAAATIATPVTIAILSQDLTSELITDRTKGFAEQMHALANGINNSVAITGSFAAINTGPSIAAVNINVVTGATPATADMANAASGILATPGLIGIFCSTENASNGLLAAINAGSTVSADVAIVGFGAGTVQKAAIAAGIFTGAVAQNPFQIGFQAVSLAVRAVRGEHISDVDTGAVWWDATNMNDPDIAPLLYS